MLITSKNILPEYLDWYLTAGPYYLASWMPVIKHRSILPRFIPTGQYLLLGM